MPDPDGAALLLVLAGVLVGAVSAVTGVLPVEAYVVAVALAQPPPVALATALTGAVGQAAGKLALFLAARSAGRSWAAQRVRRRADRSVAVAEAIVHAAATAAVEAPPHLETGRRRRAVARVRRWARWLLERSVDLLESRWGALVVLVSAVVGLPPLMAISLAAGVTGMRASVFVVACLVGRAVRLGLLALVPGALGA